MNHRTGHCMTINECYPTWKVFHTEAKDSWAFGLYNMCFKEGAEGRQVCDYLIEVIIDSVLVLYYYGYNHKSNIYILNFC